MSAIGQLPLMAPALSARRSTLAVATKPLSDPTSAHKPIDTFWEDAMTHKPSVAVIGAGIGGLCAGIKLKEAGFNDLVVLEKGDRVGGTWRDNSYPGCCCD